MVWKTFGIPTFVDVWRFWALLFDSNSRCRFKDPVYNTPRESIALFQILQRKRMFYTILLFETHRELANRWGNWWKKSNRDGKQRGKAWWSHQLAVRDLYILKLVLTVLCFKYWGWIPFLAVFISGLLTWLCDVILCVEWVELQRKVNRPSG